jgi:hypothetical protein
MPSVPVTEMTFVPNIQPQGLQAYNTIDHASPENFGGQVGQTLNQTGDMLQQNAIQRQTLINKSRADDLYSTQYMPAFGNLVNEFYSIKGQAAEDSYKDYIQKLSQLQKDYSGQLPNGMSQYLFDEMSRRTNAMEIVRMSAHAASESNAWQTKANDSLLNTYVMDGTNNYNDPQALKSNHEQIIHQAQVFGQLHNIDQATVDLSVANHVNSMYYNAIYNQMVQDPAQAQAMLDKYGRYMNANSVGSLTAKLADSTAEVRRKAVDYASQYTYGAFNLADPNADVGKATAWITNPENYKPLGLDAGAAGTVAAQIKAQWETQRQVTADARKTTDDNFERQAYGHQIPVEQLMSWKDPKTGLQPDITKVRQVQEWIAHPAITTHSDPQVMQDLSGAVSDRRLLDAGPLNAAYSKGQITEGDWKDLVKLQEVSQDKTKSRWFPEVEQLYKSRYQDNLGNWASDSARSLYPQYISNLDDAVREQNLKGHQVIEMANKMLEPVDSQIVRAHWYSPTATPQSAIDFATQWGGFPKPVINQTAPASPAPAAAPAAPPANAPSPGAGDEKGKGIPTQIMKQERSPSPDQAGLDWTRAYLTQINKEHAKAGLPQIPVTDANVKAAHENLKSQDPQYWKNWTLKQGE